MSLFTLGMNFNPLNLGQAFPDYAAPKFMTDGLAQVATSKNCLLHQYTRDYGHPRLVAILAKLYSQLCRRKINSDSEILITVGAQEALFSSINGHIDEGDEVIIIEPFYESYKTIVESVGGKPRFIPLRPKQNESTTSADWVLDKEELANLFNSKTKALILNNPNNPLGKVFNKEELKNLADLCEKWNVLCIVDEAYEWIVYKPNEHIRFASLPGMWKRTITIGSLGTTFSVSGWKIGWAYGPSNLLHNLQMVHQNSVYTGNTPMQEVAAINFENEFVRIGQENCYFNTNSAELELKRNFIVKTLKDVGMKPIVPNGGYIIIADWSPLESQVDLSSEKDKHKDYRFVKWMIKNVGLEGIPLTAFYSEDNKPLVENFVGYCFAKTDATLQKANEIFKKCTFIRS